MTDFLILLRYRWLAWRRGGRRAGARPPAHLSLYALLLLLLQNLALASLILFVLFSVTAPGAHETLLSLVAHGLAIGALLLALTTAIHTGLGELYEAPCLEVLLSWPLDTAVLYAAGFSQVFLVGAGGAAGFIVPAWVALGLASRAGWGFILAGCGGLLAEVLLGSALACLALSLVLRYFGAARLRRAFIGALLTGLVVSILLVQIAAARLIDQAWSPALTGLSATLRGHGWLPYGLVVRASLAVRASRLGGCLALLGLLWGFASLTAIVCLRVGGHSYQTCWSRAHDAGAGRARYVLRSRPAGRPWRVTALFAKDWMTLLREPLFAVNTVVFLLMVSFYAWGVARNKSLAAVISPMIEAMHLFMVAFFATGWLGQAGAMAVSREGHSWWQLQVAPLTPSVVVRAKLLFGATGLLAYFAAAWAALLSAGVRLPGIAVSLALLGGMIGALCAAGLLADLVLPDFSLRIDLSMSGAHSGGKTKVFLAVVASFLVTAGMSVVFGLAQTAAGPLAAALLVLVLGVAALGLAFALGKHIVRGLLAAEL